MTYRVSLRPWLLAAVMAALPLSDRPALAADLPPDCSQATIPDQPAKGKIADKDFVPDSASFSTINHPEINGAPYDSFDLYLRAKDKAGQGMLLEINTIVPQNSLPDGQTFTFLPVNDASKQPTVGPGAAGIQGWMLEDDDTGLNADGSTVKAGTLTPNATRRFLLSGKSFAGLALPPDVKGVLANVTTLQSEPSGGFVTAFPGDVADANRPNVSTVNPSTAIAASFWANGIPTAGTNPGTQAVYSTNSLDLIVDVVGYFR